MVELTAFSYHPEISGIHSMDARFKLLFLVLISLSSLSADPLALLILTVVLTAMIISIRLPFRAIVKELRYILFLLFLVFIARALSTPGVPLFQISILSVTGQGLYDGALVCWRLAAIITAGLLFVATTRISEIKVAVAWFLSPVPLIPEKRVSTMIGLIVRFIPVILSQAKETVDAQRARGIENRKNPAYRLIKLVIPITRRTFENADKLIVAMEARCYTENRTEPELISNRKDWFALFLVICLCILIIRV